MDGLGPLVPIPGGNLPAIRGRGGLVAVGAPSGPRPGPAPSQVDVEIFPPSSPFGAANTRFFQSPPNVGIGLAAQEAGAETGGGFDRRRFLDAAAAYRRAAEAVQPAQSPLLDVTV